MASPILVTLTLPDNTGAARMVYEFVRSLIDAGHDVTVAHGAVPRRGESILPALRDVGADLVLEERLANPVGRGVVTSISEIALSCKAAAIIGVMQRDRAVAINAARRADVPGIILAQNQHRFRGRFGLSTAKRQHYARSVRHASLAICTSDVVRDEMISFGIPGARTVVLPNGIQTGRPHPRDNNLRQQFGAGTDDLVLLNVGRLDRQKGQDVLIDSLADATLTAVPWLLLLVGAATGGAAEQSSNAYANELGRAVSDSSLDDRIKFLGWRDDVDQLLNSADIYVHAARWEGPALPLAVMEAMEAGLPCVITDCSGIAPGFVPGLHGEVVPVDDVAALRAAIRQVAQRSRADRQRMGRAGQELIRSRYDIEDIGNAFVGHVQTLLRATAT